jgi:hypothetical protein
MIKPNNTGVYKYRLTCSSLNLQPSKRYIISAWVKETDLDGFNLLSNKKYDHTSICINHDSALTFIPEGPIIDGWQKITAEFKLLSTSYLEISLKNLGDNSISYFDDIRIHPYHSNLKSFVYDYRTQKLMAELDENNFATFYEYDQEGGLIRVKKETEKGVYTIQETRSSNPKK